MALGGFERFRIVTLGLIMLTPGAAMAQKGQGSIVGTVVDPQGRPIPEATVAAILQFSGPGFFTPAQASTVSATNGVFSFQGLRTGSYQICTAVPRTLYLDPCTWGGAQMVAIGSDSGPANVKITLGFGTLFLSRLADPNKVWASAQTGKKNQDIRVSLRTPGGLTIPISPITDPNGALNFGLQVPFGAPLSMSLSSFTLQFDTPAGADSVQSISSSNKVITVTPKSGAPAVITANITAAASGQ